MYKVRLKASLAVMLSSLNSATARPKNKQKQKNRTSTQLFKVGPPAFLSSESFPRFLFFPAVDVESQSVSLRG